jgi:hypothetical protein
VHVDTDETCKAGRPNIDVNIREVDLDKVGEAKHLLSVMMYYRKLCDDKASILLAIFGAVVTAIIMMGASQISELMSSLTEQSGIGSSAIKTAIIISAAVVGLGLASLIYTVDPVTKTLFKKGKKDEEGSESILYFKGVVKDDCKGFKERYAGYDSERYLSDILEEVHITSEVCVTKYKSLKLGLRLSAVGIGAFALLILIGFWYVG